MRLYKIGKDEDVRPFKCSSGIWKNKNDEENIFTNGLYGQEEREE